MDDYLRFASYLMVCGDWESMYVPLACSRVWSLSIGLSAKLATERASTMYDHGYFVDSRWTSALLGT